MPLEEGEKFIPELKNGKSSPTTNVKMHHSHFREQRAIRNENVQSEASSQGNSSGNRSKVSKLLRGETLVNLIDLQKIAGDQRIEVEEEQPGCKQGKGAQCACITCMNHQLDTLNYKLDELKEPTTSDDQGKGASTEIGKVPDNTSSWASLLSVPSKGRGKIPLLYTPCVGSEDNPVIEVDEAELEMEKSKFEEYLVGSFIGKKLAYIFVKETLTKLWALKGDFEMSTKGFNMYFFKFSNQEDREKILKDGSQHMASKLFILRPWRPFIEVEKLDLNIIPILVVLKNVPINMKNHEGLGRIASSVGIPLYLDKATEEGTRTIFSRVCVEISTKCKYPEVITLKCKNGQLPQVYADSTPRIATVTEVDAQGTNDEDSEARGEAIEGETQPVNEGADAGQNSEGQCNKEI
ncbi:hypothetical protein GIB67_021974 [Kingdonia uniflora]|uniref:DUF4283 domain-containing protein n=1 Tax=Kingdonia uniflora TaxID=39325 RepID=A0A7J7P8J5_9MAGN|nr:hypothetical protein GIB67_021974 [Kingdonia uniflora]